MIAKLLENILNDFLLETDNHFTYIHNPNQLFVHSAKSILISIILLFGISSGCIYTTEETNKIALVINYEKTNGTIIESFVDGQIVSKVNVTLDFDFSNTVSDNKITEFGIDIMDGSSPITVDPKMNNEIMISFSEHGIYEINAYAKDEKHNIENMTITIRIELKIEWLENNTYDPKPLVVDSIPKNLGRPASSIIINSHVENPALIEGLGGGREVEITWALIDQQEDSCQSKKGLVEDGENLIWKTIHFNTYENHELRIFYEEGQDPIDVNQSVIIEYSPIESEPNY